MKAYLERFGHETQLGTDFQSASAALADFMYQVQRCMLLCWIIGLRSGRHSSLLPQHLHHLCLFPISFCLVHVRSPHAAQVALPHYREGWFLARAAARYKRFLHLHRLHGKTTLIPPPDIDLCWRTHQVSELPSLRRRPVWHAASLCFCSPFWRMFLLDSDVAGMPLRQTAPARTRNGAPAVASLILRCRKPCHVLGQVSHVAYSADSMALFGDIYLRDDGQLHWKPGMLAFNFQLTEVRFSFHSPFEKACAGP